MKLQISYFGDTDTLSLWNRQPAWSADDVAQNLIIDLDASGRPVGLTLEHAAKLLLPLLAVTTPVQKRNRRGSSKSRPSLAGVSDRREDIELQIDYHQQAGTLWLGNGLPTPKGVDISEYVTSVFDNNDRPNGVTIEHAREILLPILQPAIKPKENASENPVKPTKATS